MTPATQAIRLATTMTGGVSLAIWMGGVARELNLLSQASEWRSRMTASEELPTKDSAASLADRVRLLYLHLIDELDVTVDVDVLSGASAGGINAASLAYSRVTGKDLGDFRELWLTLGSLVELLREPTDTYVPSLMYGDLKLFAPLNAALAELRQWPVSRASDRSLDPPPTTLFVTTTLMTGETSRFTDSYGTVVQDVDHHGVFTFTETDLARPDIAAALALAARSSAAFPAAFEPSYVPWSTPTPASPAVPARPAMAPFANITRSHWVADGGLLDNQPIGALLQTVFDRTADRLVRRVLLYVVPSAGLAPDASQAVPDDQLAEPFGLVDGLLKDLGAVLNQSIAADLRTIRDHNDRVGVRTDSRLQLALLGSRLHDERLLTASQENQRGLDGQHPMTPPTLFEDYCTRQADAVARPLVATLMRQLTTWPAANAGDDVGRARIPERWQQSLTIGDSAERKCREAVIASLRSQWGSIPQELAALARLGRPAYDGGKAVALSVLRAVYPLVPAVEDRMRLAGLVAAAHDAFTPPAQVDLPELVNRLCREPNWQKQDLWDVAVELARRYLVQSAVGDNGRDPAATLETAWHDLAAVFTDTVTLDWLTSIVTDLTAEDPADVHPASTQQWREKSAAQLNTYLNYFRPAGADETQMALRIFDLFATQRAMLPVSADIEQPVEFVQISADTRTVLDLQRQTARAKLTGEQLHHFGAFYKPSWRANDWMWGRLDAAGWLVHLLLDPRQIQRACEAAQLPEGTSAADWFIQRLGTITGEPLPANIQLSPPDETSPSGKILNEAAIRSEVAYLDDPKVALPQSLPLTALWLATGWQRLIAAEELPVVADATLNRSSSSAVSAAGGAYRDGVDGKSARWAASVAAEKNPQNLIDMAGQLLTECPVPEESLASEVGSPLMVRTVSKAAATAAAALNSVKQIPGTVRPVVRSVRTVSLTGYRVTNVVKPIPRILILVGLVGLIIGVAAAIQQATILGVTGMIIAATGAYLIVFGAWQTNKYVLSAVVSVTVLGATASLALPAVRRGLFGTSATDNGWLGGQVHWIGSTWWHPFIVLGAILLPFVIIAVMPRLFGHSRKTPSQRSNP